MAHLQYRKSSYHELSWIEIKRRLQIDNAQLSAIEQFIDQEFIRSGLPQSGPNMAAPPFEHHKPLLEFVLDEATQVFNITVPAETTVDDARNALRAVVHNIRRRQRDRNSRPRKGKRKARRVANRGGPALAAPESPAPAPVAIIEVIANHALATPVLPPVPPSVAAALGPLDPLLVDHGLSATELARVPGGPGAIMSIEPIVTAAASAATSSAASVTSLSSARRLPVRVWYWNYAVWNLEDVIL